MSDFGDASTGAAAAGGGAPSASSRSRDGHTTARGGGGGGGRSGAQSSALSDDDSDSAGPFPLGGAAGGGAHSSPLDFVEWGPPPDLAQRELIFDSLNKIVAAQPQKNAGGKGQGGQGQAAQKGDSRGTYVFTVGAVSGGRSAQADSAGVSQALETHAWQRDAMRRCV